MAIVSVTATHANEIPPVRFEQLDHFSYLQRHAQLDHIGLTQPVPEPWMEPWSLVPSGVNENNLGHACRRVTAAEIEQVIANATMYRRRQRPQTASCSPTATGDDVAHRGSRFPPPAASVAALWFTSRR